MVYGAHVLAILFAECECGQRLNDALCKIDDLSGQLDWYTYPIEFQKMLPIITSNTQQPVVLKCFDCTSCSHEQFETVSYCYKIN